MKLTIGCVLHGVRVILKTGTRIRKDTGFVHIRTYSNKLLNLQVCYPLENFFGSIPCILSCQIKTTNWDKFEFGIERSTFYAPCVHALYQLIASCSCLTII